MNIIESEIPHIVEAKTCGFSEKEKRVSYHFIESSHNLCLEKNELLLAQIQACERLLKYGKENEEISILTDEIARLKLALDLVQYCD